MPLWQIEAIVPPDDPHWLGRPAWRNVLARAPSATAARVIAGTMEDTHSIGNESNGGHTGFSDEKLYWVKQVLDAGVGLPLKRNADDLGRTHRLFPLHRCRAAVLGGGRAASVLRRLAAPKGKVADP